MSSITVNKIYNSAGTEVYTCKAWVNFNGTGTVAIRASGNVSSITDNNTGDYTVNFTTAMPDENYSTSSVCEGFSSGAIDNPNLQIHNSVAPTSAAVRVQSKRNATNDFVDRLHNNVAIFR